MKKIILATFSLLLMVAVGGGDLSAKTNKQSQQSQQQSKQEVRSSSRSSVPSTYKSKPVTVVKDSKPKVISKAPTKAVTVRHKGVDYYRNGSKYYKFVGGRYVLVAPPFGLRISLIPALHTLFTFNNISYYCSDGVIYQPTADDQFVVVQPEVGMVIPELPEVNVRTVNIDGTIYFEFEGILYKQVPTATGVQYKVTGSLND